MGLGFPVIYTAFRGASVLQTSFYEVRTIADKRNGTPLGFAHFKIGTFFKSKEVKLNKFSSLVLLMFIFI